MGDILFNEKRYQDALNYYNNAIQLNPNSAPYWKSKGDTLN